MGVCDMLHLVRLHMRRTCGLVAMTLASHAEGRRFDPGQVYSWYNLFSLAQKAIGNATGSPSAVPLSLHRQAFAAESIDTEGIHSLAGRAQWSHSATVSMKSCMGLEAPRVTHTSSTSSPGRVAATPTLGINRRAAEAPGLTDPGLCGIPSCLSLLRKAALKACGEPCDSHSLWEHDVTPSLMSTSQQDTNSAG